MRRFIIDCAICIIIVDMVIYGWKLLELLLEPSLSDGIVGIVFILSLELNYLIMRDKG